MVYNQRCQVKFERKKLMTKKITVELTENQARIILHALENESNDDVVERGEYSYYRCLIDLGKKFKKAGL